MHTLERHSRCVGVGNILICKRYERQLNVVASKDGKFVRKVCA